PFILRKSQHLYLSLFPDAPLFRSLARAAAALLPERVGSDRRDLPLDRRTDRRRARRGGGRSRARSARPPAGLRDRQFPPADRLVRAALELCRAVEPDAQRPADREGARRSLQRLPYRVRGADRGPAPRHRWRPPAGGGLDRADRRAVARTQPGPGAVHDRGGRAAGRAMARQPARLTGRGGSTGTAAAPWPSAAG